MLENGHEVSKGTAFLFLISQVESFAWLLNSLYGGIRPDGLHASDRPQGPSDGRLVEIIDFGSGTGSLGLPLAWLFPNFRCVIACVVPVGTTLFLSLGARGEYVDITYRTTMPNAWRTVPPAGPYAG